MLQELRISGFRRYSELTLNNLGKINFILGGNNIGKTSILEAIFAWACGQNILPMVSIPLARGRYTNMQNAAYWEMEELLSMVHDKSTIPFQMEFDGKVNGQRELFHHTIVPSELLTDYDTSYKDSGMVFIPRTSTVPYFGQVNLSPIQITNPAVIAEWTVSHNDNHTDVEKATLTSPPTFATTSRKPYCNAKFIDVLSQTGIQEIAQIYASLKRERLIEEVSSEMGKIFPDIQNFDMIPYPDGSLAPVSVVRRDGSLLPLYAYGDGVQRWFYVLGCMALYRDSILCIDEVDSGFHPRAQSEFCRHLLEGSMRYHVQLFVTTHNLEFLDHFLEAAQDCKYADDGNAIRILSLREKEGSVLTRNLTSEEAYQARKEFNMEMRG